LHIDDETNDLSIEEQTIVYTTEILVETSLWPLVVIACMQILVLNRIYAHYRYVESVGDTTTALVPQSWKGIGFRLVRPLIEMIIYWKVSNKHVYFISLMYITDE
jgi:hypothetical protein